MQFDLTLHTPFSCLISGSSQSGKTSIIVKLLTQQDSLLDQPFDNIIYCFGVEDHEHYNFLREHLTNIKFIEGFPESDIISMFPKKYKNSCLIIDDLMLEIENSTVLQNLYTKLSHHLRISIILVTQNLFQNTSVMRTVHRNLQLMFLTKSVRDVSMIRILGQQMYPNQSKYFLDAYRQATTPKYGFFVIDMRIDTPQEFRLRSGFFVEDDIYVYLPIV